MVIAMSRMFEQGLVSEWPLAEQIAAGLNEAAIDFAGGDTRQEDDYTTVVLKFL